MKRSKLSETKIVGMLSEGESGVPVDDLCRKYQISSATYYKLRSKYSGMSISELKRLKELEVENCRLKAMYAEISLEHSILKEVLEKKFPGLIEDD
jgi:putative transposase